LCDLAHVRDVDDQWIGGRPFFRIKDFLHGIVIERVRAEAVDGLGREGDEFAT
jgi:hypothetical protein